MPGLVCAPGMGDSLAVEVRYRLSSVLAGSLQKNSVEHEGYAGVHNPGRITENNIINANYVNRGTTVYRTVCTSGVGGQLLK